MFLTQRSLRFGSEFGERAGLVGLSPIGTAVKSDNRELGIYPFDHKQEAHP